MAPASQARLDCVETENKGQCTTCSVEESSRNDAVSLSTGEEVPRGNGSARDYALLDENLIAGGEHTSDDIQIESIIGSPTEDNNQIVTHVGDRVALRANEGDGSLSAPPGSDLEEWPRL